MDTDVLMCFYISIPTSEKVNMLPRDLQAEPRMGPSQTGISEVACDFCTLLHYISVSIVILFL